MASRLALVVLSVAVVVGEDLPAHVHQDARALGADAINAGTKAYAAGKLDDAERLWSEGLMHWEAAGDPAEQASALRNLTFLPRLSLEQRFVLGDRALALVSGTDHRRTEGLVRANLADFEFLAGNYAAADAELARAMALLAGVAGADAPFARALTSRGRLRRSMGLFPAAVDDQRRAADILERIGDHEGASQAHHGVATSLNWNGQEMQAVEEFATAIALARKSGQPNRLGGALASAAVVLTKIGRTSAAAAMYQEADGLPLIADVRGLVDVGWAELLLSMGRPAEALARIDSQSALAVRAQESHAHRLFLRANILDALGTPADALVESTRAMAVLESIRERLVPADDAKRGYSGVRADNASAHVSRLRRAGRAADALEAAERARGRAFLDLLATTNLRGIVPAAAAPPSAPVDRAPPPAGPVEQIVAANARGGRRHVVFPEPDISSVAVAALPTLASMRAQAARLHSHVVSYWVTPEKTLLWVLAPDGTVTSTESIITATRLATLVQQAAAPLATSTTTRGARSQVTMSADSLAAYRQLYRLLVAPIRDALPHEADGLVTIVPHGPLFRLSFAALVAQTGRYLVEEWPLHYASSVSALAFTESRRAGTAASALVVADPVVPAGLGADLPRLTGAAREGRAVVQAIGASRARLMAGRAATEADVRAAAVDARVIHFATHAVIRDDRPFESFLALGGAPGHDATDGRLTTTEVYGLRIGARLVVLSGCGTALGPVTGDGIVGMTRAFFAAGAPSVVASLWDLPDEVTARTLPAFYTSWARQGSKARALQDAQVALLEDLRAGRVRVDSPIGAVTLPEHPSLWAGLVLVGEP